LLHVEDLQSAFRENGAWLPVVDRVSFAVSPGETLAIVGESGCGKTLTALSVLRLLPPRACVLGGSVRFRGRELLSLREAAMRELRGGEIGMVFQEPMTSLNPVLKIGTQITETLRRHRGHGRREARERAAELLAEVGVPDPAARLLSYPHELSGGLRQRVMIAMALACDPTLLIADEPTTALDVSIQAQILELIARLKSERGLAVLLITHDLGVVGELGRQVLVMYAGQIVESAPAALLLGEPRHPYTRALLAGLPRLDRTLAELPAIPGSVPRPGAAPAGCRFRERCALALPECREEQAWTEIAPRRALRCWRAEAGA